MTVDPSFMSVVSLMQTMPTTRRMRTTLIHRMVPSLSDVLLWPEASSATVPPALRDVVIDGRTGKMHEFGEDPEELTPTEVSEPEVKVEVEVEIEVAQAHVEPAAIQEPEPEPEPEAELEQQPEQEQQLEQEQQPEQEPQLAAPTEEDAAGEGEEHGAEHIDLENDRLAASDAEGAASGVESVASAEIAQVVEESKPGLEHPVGTAAEEETLAEPQEASTDNPDISTVFTEESGEIEQEQLEVKFATSLK